MHLQIHFDPGFSVNTCLSRSTAVFLKASHTLFFKFSAVAVCQCILCKCVCACFSCLCGSSLHKKIMFANLLQLFGREFISFQHHLIGIFFLII